jgi:chemotaxis protein CheD
MRKPDHVIEIFLQPGDFYFGDKDTRIRTVLGSCVSITMWHPQKLIGGMCHYMLPTRGKKHSGEPDGKYADEAMEMFMREIRAAHTQPSEYQVKIFGAGNMFPASGKHGCQRCTPELAHARPEGGCPRVHCRNGQVAHYLVKKHGFSIHAKHLGGEGHRQLFFDIWSGYAWMKHVPATSIIPIKEAGQG